MKSPELLSPAGDLDRMRTAFDYGADAVYAGQPRYSLRVRENDFSMANLEIGIKEAHARGKKFFVASNISPHNAKVKTYMRDMEPVINMQPDALIMSDPGLIMMVREKWPEMPIHLSVQANAVNYASVKFWQKMGLTRVILSRELSIDEIKEIRQECPEMELEVFIHGALCIAYSGRCLLSGYFNSRDPNQGTCTNSCRWDYKVHDAKEDAAGVIRLKDFDIEAEMERSNLSACGSLPRHPEADKVFLIEEKGRPGELLPIMEDEHGTYIMNSKDLRAIEHVEKLIKAGVDSLKIEGRTKSRYYVHVLRKITVRLLMMPLQDGHSICVCLASWRVWRIEAIPMAFISDIILLNIKTIYKVIPNQIAACMWAMSLHMIKKTAGQISKQGISLLWGIGCKLFTL